MNIDCTITKSDDMNIDGVNSKLDDMNIDCTITKLGDMNIDCGKTEIMSPSKLNESEPYDIFNQLPLEVINKIVLELDFNDVLNLKLVNKMWRCVYLNQNEIWARICKNLNIRAIDYNRCINDWARHDSECMLYAEIFSEKLFGPLCDNWLTFNHYIKIVKNMKNNHFPVIKIPRRRSNQSYYTDDYIVNINYYYKKPIEILILNGAHKPIEKRIFPLFNLLNEFIKKSFLKKYPLKVIGNKKFLVLEICSIIFVYSIKNTKFNKKFFKVIQKSADYGLNKDDFNEEFLIDHCDTKFDLYDNKLALVHPATSTLFVTNLSTEETYKELKFSSRGCIVDSMKCSDYRLMIGITKPAINNFEAAEHLAILHKLNGCTENNKIKISLLGPVTQFKAIGNYIGVENRGPTTPFITLKNNSVLNTFWIECDSFSFDCTRNYIYYNVNQSIFQYDILKTTLLIQKIAVDAISNLFPLTSINDRYLLVRSTLPNSYEIIDVKEHVSIRTIKLTPGYSLVHVGKLCMIFSNSYKIMVVAFN